MKTVKLKLLHRALVLVNAYNCAKFQLPSSISYGDMEGSKNKKQGLLISPDVPQRTNYYTQPQYLQMATSVPNFDFLAESSSISFRDMRRFQNKNYELLNQTPLADKFCTWRQHAYMPTSVPNFKFLAPLVTEIWMGSQNKIRELLIPDAPQQIIFYVAIVPANACQHTKFQLSRSISFGDIRGGVQNKKWELLISPDAPQRTNFYTGRQYTRKCLHK